MASRRVPVVDARRGSTALSLQAVDVLIVTLGDSVSTLHGIVKSALQASTRQQVQVVAARTATPATIAVWEQLLAQPVLLVTRQ